MTKCQSCAMPMARDPNGGGTEKDGSRSLVYCSLCYSNGDFHFKTDDVRAYQAMVVNEMVKNGWWRPLAWLFTREIPKLSRWKSTSS
jgi:hypothetical protein